MTTKEITELIEAVDNINLKLVKQLREIYQGADTLEFRSHGCMNNSLHYMGRIIWDDGDLDDREWIEDTTKVENGIASTVKAHYELWEHYLTKKMTEIINQVSKIKI